MLYQRGQVVRRTEEPDWTRNCYEYSGRPYHALFTFAGAQQGPQYNRERWYDPQAGRWMREDPIGFAGGDSNLYRYVGNSYANATDPSGQVIATAVGAGAGFLIGGVAAGISSGQWDADHFWAGAASGALIGAGIGFAIDTGGGGLAVSGALIGAGIGSAAGGGQFEAGGQVNWGTFAAGAAIGAATGAQVGAIAGAALSVGGLGVGAGAGTVGGAFRAGGAAFLRGQALKAGVGGVHGGLQTYAGGGDAFEVSTATALGGAGGFFDVSNSTYYAAGGSAVGAGVGYLADGKRGALRGMQVGGLAGGLYGGYRYARGLADPEVTGSSTWLGGLIGPQAKVGLKAVAFDAAGAVGGGALGLAASGGDWDVALQYAGYGQMTSLDSWGDLAA